MKEWSCSCAMSNVVVLVGAVLGRKYPAALISPLNFGLLFELLLKQIPCFLVPQCLVDSRVKVVFKMSLPGCLSAFLITCASGCDWLNSLCMED